MPTIPEQQMIIEGLEGELPLFSFDRTTGKYTFRCPVCGDSKKNPYKKRGNLWLPKDSDMYIYHCYNCGASMNLRTFLKLYFPHAYREYLKLMFGELKGKPEGVKPFDIKKRLQEQKEKVNNRECDCGDDDMRRDYKVDFSNKGVSRYDFLKDLKPIHASRYAIDYMNSRGLGDKKNFFYVDNADRFFEKWTGRPVALSGYKMAIVAPCFTPTGERVLGFVMRLIQNNKRYLNGRISEFRPMLWGLDRIDTSRPILLTEGIFDAACLPNAAAALNADLAGAAEIFDVPPEQIICVHDNDWRYNRDVRRQMEESIEKGHRIVIFPDSWPKDINDMVLAYGRRRVFREIAKHTYGGEKAKFMMAKRRRD